MQYICGNLVYWALANQDVPSGLKDCFAFVRIWFSYKEIVKKCIKDYKVM